MDHAPLFALASLLAASLTCGVPVAAQSAGDGPGMVTLHVGGDVGRTCYRAAVAQDVSPRAFGRCDRAVTAYADRPRPLAAALSNRGTLHYFAGRYPEAAGDFTRALEAAGERAILLTNRGLAREQLGRTEESWDALARRDYERALRLNPDDALARQRLGEMDKPRRERTFLPRNQTV